jgi:hypothetical protein
VTFHTAELGAPREYGIGRQERGFLFGGRWTAYDHTTEAGMRLGDAVGRLDTIALAATGPDRGFAIASTFRGWPVAVTAHVFSLRDRRGLELRAERESHSPGLTTYFAAGTSSRAFGTAAVTLHQRQSSVSARIDVDSDRHLRASIGGSARAGDLRITFRGEAGRNLTIGGLASSALPDSLRVERVDAPALPDAFQFARRYRSGRLGFVFGGTTFFWQRYDAGASDIDVRGIEVAISSPPIALVRAAGLDFTAGAAKVTGLRGVKGWLALRWRP